MSSLHLLGRPVMTAPEAARQLGIPAATLIRWLDGTHHGGRWYPPVLREEPTGSADMTWGEIVEARYLRAYRAKSVPIQRLRPFISGMREQFGIPCPLARFRPFASGRRLLAEAQEQARLPENMRMVYEVSTGQLILDPRVTGVLDQVEFADGENEALRIRPAGKDSPVVIDPLIASGAPTVRGTRTEVLAEQASGQSGRGDRRGLRHASRDGQVRAVLRVVRQRCSVKPPPWYVDAGKVMSGLARMST